MNGNETCTICASNPSLSYIDGKETLQQVLAQVGETIILWCRVRMRTVLAIV